MVYNASQFLYVLTFKSLATRFQWLSYSFPNQTTILQWAIIVFSWREPTVSLEYISSSNSCPNLSLLTSLSDLQQRLLKRSPTMRARQPSHLLYRTRYYSSKCLWKCTEIYTSVWYRHSPSLSIPQSKVSSNTVHRSSCQRNHGNVEGY